MANRDIRYNIETLTCPICGKVFIPAPYHVYKADGVPVCTWRCSVEARKCGYKRSNKKTYQRSGRYYSGDTKKRAVEMVLDKGLRLSEAAKAVGCAPCTVHRWLIEYEDGKIQV